MESNPGQTLSPEAAVFVPRQNPNCMGTSLQLQQIPTYMTNCYPFVQGEMDRIQAGLNHGTRQIRPSGHLNNKAVRLMSETIRQQRNRNGVMPINSEDGRVLGNRFPRPQTSNPPVQNFSGDTNHWKGVISPGPPLVNNLFPGTVINAANDMESPVVQGHFPKFPNSSRRQFKSSAKKGDERQNEDLSQNLMSRMPASNLHEENHSSNSYRGNRRGGRGRRKEWQKERQEKPDGHRNNLAMGNNSTSHISKKTDLVPTIPFAGGHTVIVKETSVQTDFPDHYANLTLLSHPSPLYSSSPQDSVLGKRPSESDADSDSGYNSPLHRKIALGGSHQPSVGTDSMMHLNHSVLSYPSNISCIQSEHVPTSSTTAGEFKLSYAFITQKKPVPKTYNTLPVTGDKDSHENHLSTDLTKTDQGGRRSRRSRSKKEESVGQSHVTFTGQSDVSQEDVKENIEETEGKKKRKRRRKRKRKKKEGEEEETGIMGSACTKQEVDLHFEDEEEFPDLTSSGIGNKQENTSVPAVSYSAKLKSNSVPQPKPEYSVDDIAKQMDENRNEENIENEQKGSRRRRKRQQMLQKAAEEELAEISFEQQMLRELNLKPKQKGIGKDTQTPGILKVNPQPSGKKSKQAVSLDLSAMIDALEKKKLDTSQKKVEQVVVKKKIHAKTEDGRRAGMGHNMLDSSAPVKRGKERENPKPKKPSSLKKVILKEREEKKKLKLLDDSETNNSIPLGVGIVCGNESDLSQDAMSTKSMNEYSYMGTPASNDLSPISQTSPISMSPLSPGVSPQSSEVNSPIAGTIGKEVRMKIHSRRFREYCNQVLNKDIDNCCTELLKDLVRFQDRIYHKDPSKAKSKRRIVLGLREVTKHLKLKKIKCVIISPNLEKIQSKGGLDDALNNILNLCNEQNTPFVFALGRRALGRACAKLVPVSVVGIFNYEGSNENFQQLMELTELARQSYKEMVSVIEKEIRDYPTLGAAAAVPHIYAHMGHSRTPSGASVLSFTSSILSEPISENYPHSEPETDSKGYEIVKDAEVEKSPEKMPFGKLKGPSIQMLKNQMIYSSVNLDVDEGNEADTEEYVQRKFSEGHGSVTEECIGYPDSDQSSDHGSDTVKALPHIDSIHSSMQELNTEILSQISGRTYDNCDAISTHSSRTLGDGSSTILADTGDRSKHDTPKSAGSPSNTLQRGKVIDAERIQNWVHQTQSRLENLQQSQENSGHESDSDTDSEDGENLEDLDGNSDQTKTENSQGHNSDGQINYEVTVKNSEPLNCPVDFRNNNGHGTVIKQENSQAHLPSIAEGSELSETEVSIKEAESSSITLTVFDS